MDKEYYDKLHNEIAKKVGTNPHLVNDIRRMYFQDKITTKEEMFESFKERLLRPSRGKYKVFSDKKKGIKRKYRKHNRQFYRDAMSFIFKISDDQFEEIVRK